MPAFGAKFARVYGIPIVQSAVCNIIAGIVVVVAPCSGSQVFPGRTVGYVGYGGTIVVFGCFQILDRPGLYMLPSASVTLLSGVSLSLSLEQDVRPATHMMSRPNKMYFFVFMRWFIW
jgi:hypothetical protein